MVCIYCGHKTHVSNSRASTKTHSTWRRRECTYCHSVFTTREHIDYSGALRVRNKNGSLEPFLRDKLFLSIYRSLSHRKTALADANDLAETVIASALSQQTNGLVERTGLRQTVITIFKRFDTVAEIHYTAHHK